MPFVNVVFPLPRSPVSKTRTGAVSRFASSRPQLVVSSEECVMISSATELNLPEETFPGSRNHLGYFVCEDAGRFPLPGKNICCSSVQINSQRKHTQPILGTKLRGQCRKNAREHVPRATFGKA